MLMKKKMKKAAGIEDMNQVAANRRLDMAPQVCRMIHLRRDWRFAQLIDDNHIAYIGLRQKGTNETAKNCDCVARDISSQLLSQSTIAISGNDVRNALVKNINQIIDGELFNIATAASRCDRDPFFIWI
jgi:hypothetical protein